MIWSVWIDILAIQNSWAKSQAESFLNRYKNYSNISRSLSLSSENDLDQWENTIEFAGREKEW